MLESQTGNEGSRKAEWVKESINVQHRYSEVVLEVVVAEKTLRYEPKAPLLGKGNDMKVRALVCSMSGGTSRGALRNSLQK